MNVTISSTTLRLSSNLDDIKSEVIKIVESQSNIELVVENYADAKAARASINKTKKAVKDAISEELAKISAPIEALKKQAKEIYLECDNAVEKISPLITSIEDAGKMEHKQKMKDYFLELINDDNMDEDIISESLNNLPSLSIAGVSKSGSLIKKFKDLIELLYRDASMKQSLRNLERKNQELEDNARAEKIIAEREVAAKKDASKSSIDETRTIKEEVHESSPEPKSSVKHTSSDGTSTYEVITTVITKRVLLVKAKSGLDVDLILRKTEGIKDFDSEESDTERVCREM